MKQFLLNTEPDKDGLVRFEGKDYNYLVRVRRLASGEFFPAVLPNGEEKLIKIISVNNRTLTGKCESSLNLNPLSSSSAISRTAGSTPPRLCENSSRIILFQALPKGDKMDTIVRQAAESGIAEIVPFVSEYSVAKTKAEGQKFSRWERIIKEARQQSGSKVSTAIHHPLKMGELFNYWQKLKNDESFQPALGLLFHHQMLQKGLEQNSLHRYLDISPKIVVLTIGPEGGFSDSEVSLFLENGFKPITIGDTILRTETAALYCTAAVRIILLEREAWELKK